MGSPGCRSDIGGLHRREALDALGNEPSPDSSFSLEPHEFRAMVEAIRTAEAALGVVSYGPTCAEEGCRGFRRSLFVVKDVKSGEILTPESVRSIRPGIGLPAKYLRQVLGRRAARDIPPGTPLTWEMLDSA